MITALQQMDDCEVAFGAFWHYETVRELMGLRGVTDGDAGNAEDEERNGSAAALNSFINSNPHWAYANAIER